MKSKQYLKITANVQKKSRKVYDFHVGRITLGSCAVDWDDVEGTRCGLAGPVRAGRVAALLLRTRAPNTCLRGVSPNGAADRQMSRTCLRNVNSLRPSYIMKRIFL